ncbi:hypothetical protein [Natrinema thermotolerans]|uniref:hypothetical protein n=1 Tax=Natrinema thermotolerans TaxID=121872 RepID=UPI0006795060|nr:hypothetical protein [Natrinema thermotolerans]QCC57253.1 hypothetical protein DVR14_00845 [Natrinema thermotolerans]
MPGHDIEQNAGRCDLCGSPIDMSSGDRLVMQEFGIPDDADVPDDLQVSDQEAADEVADALETVGEDGADYDLAETIREDLEYRVHADCLDETNFDMLETEVPA